MELELAMPVSEAAAALRVNPRRVRRLASDGSLPAARIGNQWFVDSRAVAVRAGEKPAAGRPLSPRGAWALLDILDGGRSELPIGEANRLRSRARAVDPLVNAQRWRIWLSRRARLARYAADADALAELLMDPRVMRGAASVQRSALSAGSRVSVPGMDELYVPLEVFERIVDEYALLPSNRPNLLIRIPAIVRPLPDGPVDVPASVEAADLLDAGDSRSMRAGAQLLSRLHQRWLCRE